MSDAKTFPPNPEFAATAHIPNEAVADKFSETAAAQPDAFWSQLARVIRFDEPYRSVLDWEMPTAKWFTGGKLNVARHCVDRIEAMTPDKTALLWEGEPVDDRDQPKEIRRISYTELRQMVCRIAGTLRELGVDSGDRVAVYMPNIPETVATMLACARIGAVHTVIFGGFSAQSINDRLKDSQARVIVTADGTWRRGKFLDLKSTVDDALKIDNGLGLDVRHVLVYRRDPTRPCPMTPGRDLAWDEIVVRQEGLLEAVPLDSEHPLFILYTSGTTGKPKGVFHTQAGYLLWAHWTTRWLFDLKNEDIYWCTADTGWITGHTYVTYGPLSNGATVFLYEGGPTHPKPDRYWAMIARHKISILYTAPTAIRTFMRLGEELPSAHDLSSLRVLGSVGEPINPEAWLWYRRVIGSDRCPVVDTWWQTETGGAMVAHFPGAHTLKPGAAGRPLPGIAAEVLDPDTGATLPAGERGVLVVKRPWPGMARGIWGDPARFERTYWNTAPNFEGVYVTADFAVKDKDGDIWIEGRMDDVLNVSGHRLGSAEVESAMVSHPAVAEAAAVGIPDAIKGQAVAVFVTVKDTVQAEITAGRRDADALKSELRAHVGSEIGAHAKPDQIRLAKALPKTRSGKIMRRLLRELAATGEMKGDTSTLEDFSPQASISEE